MVEFISKGYLWDLPEVLPKSFLKVPSEVPLIFIVRVHLKISIGIPPQVPRETPLGVTSDTSSGISPEVSPGFSREVPLQYSPKFFGGVAQETSLSRATNSSGSSPESCF